MLLHREHGWVASNQSAGARYGLRADRPEKDRLGEFRQVKLVTPEGLEPPTLSSED
jgi:hypothetical protein